MNVQLNKLNFTALSSSTQHKMVFILNALDDGWIIQKNKNKYIFTKPQEGKKEIFLDSYLLTFMKDNLSVNNLIE